jgi:hypothetical protein
LPSPKSRKISGGIGWPFSVKARRTSATSWAVAFFSELPAAAKDCSEHNSAQRAPKAMADRRVNIGYQPCSLIRCCHKPDASVVELHPLVPLP